MESTCKQCGNGFPRRGRALFCSSNCRRRSWNKGHKPERKDYHLRTNHNISLSELRAMLARQGGACAVCRTVLDEIAAQVDHDHKCCPGKKTCGKCIRGLLCKRCNQGIGLFEDSSKILQAASEYVRTADGEHH